MKFEHGGTVLCGYDYSINLNPLGIPEEMKKILKSLSTEQDVIEAYPDPDCRLLQEKIAGYYNCDKENVVIGCGASGIMFSLCLAIKPKHALLVSPTFSEYERDLLYSKAEINYHCLKEENGFVLDETYLSDLNLLHSGDIAFLCNPNNPVGNIINPSLMDEIIKKAEEKGIFLVLDECFMDFTSFPSSFEKIRNKVNVIWINTFTKLYSVPALRVGYAYCSDKDLACRIKEAGPMWSVSGLAQKVVAVDMNHTLWEKNTIEFVKDQREKLTAVFKTCGFKVYDSQANFILVKTEDTELYKYFLDHDISIRKCSNYRGLDNHYFRFAVKDSVSNEYLISIIRGYNE